tara:strand:- start:368 stop:748 length:381 start_codon:yes stop_codon:yes gene_type:complete
MADEKFERIRFAFMQDFLPVGLAMMNRVKTGGTTKIVEVFQDSENPLDELREEGEPAAKDLRDRLDKVSPGLGNPVVPVSVSVETEVEDIDPDGLDEVENLNRVLTRIEKRLDLLEANLSNQSLDL